MNTFLDEKPLELKDKWSDKHRKSTHLALKYQKPKEPTDVKFPSCLVLGPDQLAAVESNEKLVWLLGEAGSGKTTVLLAILYKNTGKHLSYLSLRNVYFVIPEEKTAFSKFVEWFVEEYCVAECVTILDLQSLNYQKRGHYPKMMQTST